MQSSDSHKLFSMSELPPTHRHIGQEQSTQQFFKDKASLRDTEWLSYLFASSYINSYSSCQLFKPHACPPAQLWLPLCNTFLFKVWLVGLTLQSYNVKKSLLTLRAFPRLNRGLHEETTVQPQRGLNLVCYWHLSTIGLRGLTKTNPT